MLWQLHTGDADARVGHAVVDVDTSSLAQIDRRGKDDVVDDASLLLGNVRLQDRPGRAIGHAARIGGIEHEGAGGIVDVGLVGDALQDMAADAMEEGKPAEQCAYRGRCRIGANLARSQRKRNWHSGLLVW